MNIGSTKSLQTKPLNGSVRFARLRGIIGITRNDQARYMFCITWARRSQVSNETLTLFGLLDDEETTENKLKYQPTRIKIEENLVTEQMKLMTSLDVFGIHYMQNRETTQQLKINSFP